jgi:hypothetical protein
MLHEDSDPDSINVANVETSQKTVKRTDRGQIRPLDAGLIQDNVPSLVYPGLYIGSVHCAFNLETLMQLGITHILNISGWPSTFPKNFVYFTVSVRDKEQASVLCCIPATNIFIEAGLTKGKVLVHCHGGRSRSAALVVAFLMSTKRISYDEAYMQLRSVRPVVSINRGFEEQLRAYGMMNFNIYQAAQYILRSRIRELFEVREAYKVGIQTGSLSLQDASPLKSFCKKITLPPRTPETPRVGPPSFINGHTLTTRLRLSRPNSNSIQIIPPLRGLERAFVCSECSSYLFTYANLFRTDFPVSDEIDISIKNSMSPLLLSSARTPHALEPLNGVLHSNIFASKLKSSEPIVPQSTRHTRKGFSFGDSDFQAPVTQCKKPTTNGRRKQAYWDDSLVAEETEMSQSMPTSMPSSPIEAPFCSRITREGSKSQPLGGLSKLSPRMKIGSSSLPSLDHYPEDFELSPAGSSSSTCGVSPPDASPPETPASTRRRSAEKEKWLQKMLLLDSSEGKLASQAAYIDEEMAHFPESGASFFLEYLAWFGDILLADQGFIHCPFEKCGAKIGEFSWHEGVHVPGTSGPTSAIGPPKFEIYKSMVREAAFHADSGLADSTSFHNEEGILTTDRFRSPIETVSISNKTILPQISTPNNRNAWIQMPKSLFARLSSPNHSTSHSPRRTPMSTARIPS